MKNLLPYLLVSLAVALTTLFVVAPILDRRDDARVIEAEKDVKAADSGRQKSDSLVTSSRSEYRRRRNTLNKTDTASVGRLVRAADSTISADSVALAAADSQIVTRDRLIGELKKRPQPRLTTFAEGLYDPLSGGFALRVGQEVRIAGRLKAVAVGNLSEQEKSLRVGLRLEF